MKNSISNLAFDIKMQDIVNTRIKYNQRLIDTLNKFNEDFASVIPDLLSCSVDYRPCFLYKQEKTLLSSDYYLYPDNTKHIGSACTADSILFTFNKEGQFIRKRIFYSNGKWYFIARRGNMINDTYYLSDRRKDLILFLDGTFEGEYN